MKTRVLLSIFCGSVAVFLAISCNARKSDSRAITAFSFTNPPETGVIDESAKTIAVQVPGGTDLKTLVATFTTTGEKVEVGSVPQTSGVTPNDFTDTVKYTVIAENKETVTYTVTVSFYKRCLFFSYASDPIYHGDTALVSKVRSWKYDVTVKSLAPKEIWPADSFVPFDFIFMSETPNSSNYQTLKGHPRPILNLEAWASDKPTVLNWGTGNSVSNYPPDTCIITGATGHPLTAGLPNGKQFRLVDSTVVPDEAVIAFVPAINVIPIAAFKDSLALVCACAVEKGTLLADSTIAQNRAVTIGIHEHAYPFITPEAYQLMQAGIHWILGETSSIAIGK